MYKNESILFRNDVRRLEVDVAIEKAAHIQTAQAEIANREKAELWDMLTSKAIYWLQILVQPFGDTLFDGVPSDNTVTLSIVLKEAAAKAAKETT